MTRSGDNAPPPPMEVLKQRNFLLYWIGQLISLTGTWMQQFALSLVVLSLVHSAFALGVVTFVSGLPPAILMLNGGVAADRFDKRRILIVTQTIFMIGAFAMAWLVHTGHVHYWHIMVFSISLGIATAYDLPANQALVPELVERNQIPPAVQLNQAIFHGSRIIGPTVAALLVTRFGLASAFLSNGISFIPVIGTLMVIRSIRQSEKRPKASMLEDMKLGLEYVKARPRIKALIGITALTTTLVFPNFAVLMPYYVEDVLKLGPGPLGGVMAVSGLAAFIGAMSLLVVPEEKRLSRIGLGFVGIVLGVSIISIAPHFASGTIGHFPVRLLIAMIGVLPMSFSISSALGLGATILQQTVPDELRGRVMSLQSLAFVGIMPFSALLMTKIVDIVTMPVELFAAAMLYALGASQLWRLLNVDHAGTSREAVPAES